MSAQTRAVLGDTGASTRTRRKSAGNRGALAGLQQTDSAQKPVTRAPSRWKKVVLGALIGITALNATVPAAHAQQFLPQDNPVQAEQTLPQETFANPLLAQLAAKGVTSSLDADSSGTSQGTLAASDSAQASAYELTEISISPSGSSNASGDHALTDATPKQQHSPEVLEGIDRATERFQDKLDDILNRDASSLARGERMFQPGDDLTSAQTQQLQNALGDFFKDLPAGALSETLTAPIKSLLDAGDVDVSGFDSTKLGDLGDMGQSLAKNLADKLKSEHPAVFYATAGAIVAGAATYGYLEGSEALRDIGIDPEVSTSLFGDRLELDVEADWESRFTSFETTVDGTYTFDKSHQLGAGVNFDGDDFNPRLSYRYDGDQWDAQFKGQFNVDDSSVDASGFVSYRPDQDLSLRLSGRADSDGDDHVRLDMQKQIDDASTLNIGVRHVWDHDGDDDVTDLNARWRLSRGDFNLDASAGYRFGNSDGFSAGLGLGYEPAENMELQIRGDLTQDGDASVGVGFTWRF